ncbi:MAG: hypothetical protein JWN48_1410 [Myxococcaceae bacterium]|nr:hypothetical protein [Myxococcaceae bacterium]
MLMKMLQLAEPFSYRLPFVLVPAPEFLKQVRERAACAAPCHASPENTGLLVHHQHWQFV